MQQEDSITRLINEFKKMPSIGLKTAQRLAFYILRLDNTEARKLAEAIVDVKEKMKYCSICGNITEEDPCLICSNSHRKKEYLCIVEEPKDILAFESTGAFKGVYHVLMGAISPINGIGPADLRIKELMQRLERESIQEVILATSPNIEGDTTATYLAEQIKPMGIKITRIARGLPMGSDIEYADKSSLTKSLECRIEV
ncbi:MAG: recombination mediator RecR [bacterium]